MSKILIFEPEARYRNMLRFILEGINHRVMDAGSWDHIPVLLAGESPDLIILGVHLGEEPEILSWPDWQLVLPDVPTLILFSGDPDLREGFMDNWEGSRSLNIMVQPIDPYPLLTKVKAMLTAPVEWRRGGQHAA
jgi:DNA-binding response OmpR family regulator